MAKKKKVQNCQESKRSGTCEMCNRTQLLTKHHLIPSSVHKKRKNIERFGKQEMCKRGMMVCKDCHHGIHDLIPDEQELADNYCTKELLLANEKIIKHIKYVRKKK